eukprot:RCo046833
MLHVLLGKTPRRLHIIDHVVDVVPLVVGLAPVPPRAGPPRVATVQVKVVVVRQHNVVALLNQGGGNGARRGVPDLYRELLRGQHGGELGPRDHVVGHGGAPRGTPNVNLATWHPNLVEGFGYQRGRGGGKVLPELVEGALIAPVQPMGSDVVNDGLAQSGTVVARCPSVVRAYNDLVSTEVEVPGPPHGRDHAVVHSPQDPVDVAVGEVELPAGRLEGVRGPLGSPRALGVRAHNELPLPRLRAPVPARRDVRRGVNLRQDHHPKGVGVGLQAGNRCGVVHLVAAVGPVPRHLGLPHDLHWEARGVCQVEVKHVHLVVAHGADDVLDRLRGKVISSDVQHHSAIPELGAVRDGEG